MASIDHIVFACNDLGWGAAFMSTLTGVNPALGGPHPGVGTHNSLVSLGEQTYLEIIAKDPEQPEPASPRPFGIDDSADPRIVTFAVHPGEGESIEAVTATMVECGFDPGPPSSMSRNTPSGDSLFWTLTSRPAGPVPFVIDWGNTPNPARSSPQGCTLARLHCTWPDPPQLRELHDALSLDTEVIRGEPSVWVTLESRHGTVELR